jgi:hypothetical protein
MSEHLTRRPVRAKVVTVALLAALLTGAVGIDAIGSSLSNEVGRTERATSFPAPGALIAPHQSSLETS